MKYRGIKSITIAILLVIGISMNYSLPMPAYGQGVTTGPPPSRPITVQTDKDVYVGNDTAIIISGKVRSLEQGSVLMIEVFNPDGNSVHSNESSIEQDGSYNYTLKSSELDIAGEYRVIATYGGRHVIDLFTFVPGPYILSIEGTNYPINYILDTGILNNISINEEEKSLTVNIINSSRTGSLAIELPRKIIDAEIGNEDGTTGDFVVLIKGNNQTDFQEADFREVQANSDSRALLIDIPYNGTNTLYDEWDIEIIGTSVIPEFGSSLAIMSILTMTIVGIMRYVIKRIKNWAKPFGV